MSNRGPVEILCEEIGFRFETRLESEVILVAFVREIVDSVADARDISVRLAVAGAFQERAPAAASEDALAAAYAMLGANDLDGLIAGATRLHNLVYQPEDGPCDHFLDMLSSCASAIRFGLESPCRSRHAAAAANHVWEQVYGVSRLDKHSARWRKAWARAKMQDAITRLALAKA